MTEAVSNRDICFIKAVLLLGKHGHFFFLFFASQGQNDPPPLMLSGLKPLYYHCTRVIQEYIYKPGSEQSLSLK